MRHSSKIASWTCLQVWPVSLSCGVLSKRYVKTNLSYLKWSINGFSNANIVGRLDFREVEYNPGIFGQYMIYFQRKCVHYSIHQYDLCIEEIIVQQVDIWRQISRVRSRLLHLSLYFHNQVWRSGGKVYNYHRVHPQLHLTPWGPRTAIYVS